MNQLNLSLPDWINSFLNEYPKIIPEDEKQMRFVLALTERNIREETGGPFGAAVFERDSGKLVSVGVNVVVRQNCSAAHAEMMALMLAQRGIDCTVTIAHSRTHDVAALCREADIVVAAIGRPHTVKPDWIKPGAAVVDVGISRADGGGLAGDVDPGVAEVAGWMTPVPGGVGPMTIAMLLSNTVRAAESS